VSNESQGRRTWLLRILVSGIAVTVGAIVYPIARFLRPRPQTSSGALEVVAPFRADELRADANGEWPPPFNFGGKPCLVVRTPDGEVKAFNAVCTHTDCTVKYRVEKSDIFCTCHGGVYNTNGQNVSGPPPRPLEAYKVILRGTPGKEEIIVTASG
jgi:Rieske Fe-S protein